MFLLLLKKWWKLVVVALVLLAGYLAWSWYGPKPPKPGSVIQAVESPKTVDMPRKVLIAKVVVVADRSTALKRLGLPISSVSTGELLQAVDTPPTRYGSTTAIMLNVSTGRTTATTIVKPAPWFSLERGNILGAEVGIGAAGRYYQGDYQRDIFQIKGVYFSGRGAVTSYQDLTDWRVGFRGEYRW
jgi:hypothetical protein